MLQINQTPDQIVQLDHRQQYAAVVERILTADAAAELRATTNGSRPARDIPAEIIVKAKNAGLLPDEGDIKTT